MFVKVLYFSIDVLLNSAGELKVRARKNKEVPVKGIIAWMENHKAVERWIVRVVIVVSMVIAALALFAAVTAHAGETIVRIEDGDLVYYTRTKVIPNVPKGITDAEQARQLVEGVIPSVDSSSTEHKDILGFPFVTKVAHSAVSFEKGEWRMEKDKYTDESLDLFSMAVFLFLIVFLFSGGFFCIPRVSWGSVVLTFFILTVAFIPTLIFAGDVKNGIGSILFTGITILAGGFLGGYLRNRKEKRKASSGHVSAKGHYHHA